MQGAKGTALPHRLNHLTGEPAQPPCDARRIDPYAAAASCSVSACRGDRHLRCPCPPHAGRNAQQRLRDLGLPSGTYPPRQLLQAVEDALAVWDMPTYEALRKEVARHQCHHRQEYPHIEVQYHTPSAWDRTPCGPYQGEQPQVWWSAE
jgi:hypothetical protein